MLVGSCFGRGAFGRVMGIGGLAGLPIVAGAGPIAGALFDLTGSYDDAFLAGIASNVVNLLLVGALIRGVGRVTD